VGLFGDVTGSGGSTASDCSRTLLPIAHLTGENIFSSKDFFVTGQDGFLHARNFVTDPNFAEVGVLAGYVFKSPEFGRRRAVLV
jgi:hypothetical protein